MTAQTPPKPPIYSRDESLIALLDHLLETRRSQTQDQRRLLARTPHSCPMCAPLQRELAPCLIHGLAETEG